MIAGNGRFCIGLVVKRLQNLLPLAYLEKSVGLNEKTLLLRGVAMIFFLQIYLVLVT